MDWDWGEGLLLYSLARLDEHKNESRYRNFIESYYDSHLKKGLPEINWSDRCAPALAAFEIYRRYNKLEYKEIALKVADYLKKAKKTGSGGLNHLGTNILSYFYPESMWVDSLMMYNVFAAKWGKYTSDAVMTQFASEQPLDFAGVLQDKNSKLWRHAYLTKVKRNLPAGEDYWLRGNGWAMVSIPETLDSLPENNPNREGLIKVLNDTAAALVPYQSEIGMWYTVLNHPGQIYLESSGTALVAYGMLKGVHQGYLPEKYQAPANKAYFSLLDRLERKEDGLSMPEISHNTMPYSFLGYSLVPQRNDLPFGLAALILAGIEYDSVPGTAL
jgi:unsaturated rhamnogalacturonyl hydrolase